MSDNRPGLNPQRLLILMEAAIQRCKLDLNSTIILTEAATGAYIVTPILAAMAGAECVYALTRSTNYGPVEEVTAQTLKLADLGGVRDRINVITQKSREIVSQADIVTNSGHVRPINAEMIDWMKPTAVIPLMYEAWEFRSGDVDLIECRRRGIPVAGTNERHPSVDVFSFLGIMAVKLLMDAGIAVYTSHILVLCDNSFGPFIERGLVNAGARVDILSSLSPPSSDKTYDAILVAMQPQSEFMFSATDADIIADRWPGTVIAQFWGDIDRSALLAANVPVWPFETPKSGHMGILPSAVGPEPIVRLQAGGLKVAEVLLSCRSQDASPTLAAQMAAQTGWAQGVEI